MISGMVPFNHDEVIARMRVEAVQSLEQKTRFFETHGVPCAYTVEENAVPSSCAVYQEGERGYSMVVMGTRGRNALLTAFFGSTARETILKASIPVIIVHSGR